MEKYIQKFPDAELVSIEVKKKQSLKRKKWFEVPGNKEKISGENNPMKRLEVKAKISGERSHTKRPEVRKKMSLAQKGKNHSVESKKKISIGQKKIWENPEYREEQCRKRKEVSNRPENKKKTSLRMKTFFDEHPENREEVRERMLNGQAVYMNSFIENPSKPQVEMYDIIKSVFPDAILNYPYGRFCLDVAVSEKLLCFEFDGIYWHSSVKAKKQDFKKDNFLKERNWKVYHFNEHTINTIENVLRELKYLV